jgi:glycine cleavage system transcriptional repressor
MASVALVSIVCRDGMGLVAAIADCLFTAGVNLRDTTFAVLGQGAEFTSVCELPNELRPDALAAALAELPELQGAQIRVSPYGFDPRPGPTATITHRVVVSGGDQLGLIARLAATSRALPCGSRPTARRFASPRWRTPREVLASRAESRK